MTRRKGLTGLGLMAIGFAALGTLLAAPLAVHAQSGDSTAASDVVRLPGRGEVKVESPSLSRADRLAPGGGLLLSFDGNGDGQVSRAEFETGVTAAFAAADGNGDGMLTVFEQLDWAESLPTRDGSLSNPVRFDPNLDRMVSYGEFSTVIRNLAAPYQDELDGSVDLAQLKRTGTDDRREVEADARPGPPGQDRSRIPRAPRSS